MSWLRSIVLLVVGILVFTLPAVAQETGEMLRFDSRVELVLEVTDEVALKRAGEVVYQSPASSESRRPYNRILINGLVTDRNLGLQISCETAPGRWGGWLEAPMKVFENGRFWARVDLTDAAFRIKYRFVNRGASAPGRIEIYAVEGIDTHGPIPNTRAPSGHPTATDLLKEGTVPKPPVVSREEWGAQPPVGEYIPHDPYRFTQHHTAGRRVETLEDGLAEMQFIQDFHQNGRGWQDIGYHFCVDDAGRIYEGVPPQYRGTHTGGANTGNVGISLFGNYEAAGEFPTQDALESLVALWSWLAFEFDVNPDLLFGHRDYSATACPGEHLYGELGDMRTGIRKTLGFGGPYVADPQPQPFSEEVPPDSGIGLFVRDDEEGVDVNSIVVRVNHQEVTPTVSGDPTEFFISYRPPTSFPSSQHVVVEVEATDLAAYPHAMLFTYGFTIEVAALHIEVDTAESARNADLELSGSWASDNGDVELSGLTDGLRLVALDDDGSHTARLYPDVEAAGDYRILMAVAGRYLGESGRYRFVNAAGAENPLFAEYNGAFDGGWGLLSPTPVFFDIGASNGFVELAGLDGLQTRLVLDALRLERVDPLDPPTAPTLKWVRVKDRARREVEVAWYPSLEGDIQGYRLMMSEDGRTWGEPLVGESTLTAASTSYTLTHGGSEPTLYFRVLAVDSNGIESEDGPFEPFVSEPTDTYGVGFTTRPLILIVDNFDRRASWSLGYHPFVRSHGEAIAAGGVGFDSCTETAVQTGEIDLADYDAVVYLCGDDSRIDESLAAADQQRLLEYLEGGGKLMISGSEIGYDFADTTPAELERVQYLLKAEYVGDLSGSNRVLGAEHTVFEGLDVVYGTIASEDTYIEDYPDYLLPFDGGRVALTYDNSRIAAVTFTGPYGAGNPSAQLVYLAFPFETVEQAEDRAELMKRVLEYFGIPERVRRPETPFRRLKPAR